MFDKSAKVQFCVRKFFCLTESCEQKIFAERLSDIVKPYSRRTIRLNHRLSVLGLKVGGNTGASIAMMMGIVVSSSTILRLACDQEEPKLVTPRVLGIDDWAFKKGRNYGTILVDLEKRQPIDLLPDRESGSIRKWLEDHPGVEIISRDRGGEYAKGSREGAPEAIQIADRWHLLKNLGDAIRRMMDKHNRDLREVAKQVAQSKEVSIKPPLIQHKSPVIPASLSTKSNPSKYELNFLEVKRLYAEGYKTIHSLFRKTGFHKETIKKYLQYDTYPEKEKTVVTTSSVEPFGEHIRKRWAEGERNHDILLAEIKPLGYPGSRTSVFRFTRHLIQDNPNERSELNSLTVKVEVWSARKTAMLLTKPSELWLDEEKVFFDLFFKICPDAKEAQRLSLEFRDMMNKKKPELLDSWIVDALKSEIQNLKRFAQGIQQDYDPVKAALTLSWSNGQVEGQVNRLKTIKRQMYGRAGFKLLRKRILFRSG